MARDEVIRIEGLREFRRALREADRNAPKGLRLAGNKAAEIVVTAARPRVPLGPGKGGHARDSIRAASTQSAARVKGGGARFPYYPWLDFGGSVGRKRSVHRPFIKEGRYIWRAFVDHKDEIHHKLADALAEVARSAGLEPRE